MTPPQGRTALYRIRGEGGALLYIGITHHVAIRWNGHQRVQPWWDELRSLTVEWYGERAAAEAAEEAAIKAEKPKYNVTYLRVRRLPAPPVPVSAKVGRSPIQRRRLPASREPVPTGIGTRALPEAELEKLPACMDLLTAFRALGLPKGEGLALVASGRFPVEIKQFGAGDRVLLSGIYRYLGLRTAWVRSAA